MHSLARISALLHKPHITLFLHSARTYSTATLHVLTLYLYEYTAFLFVEALELEELTAAPQKPRIATTAPAMISVHISVAPASPMKATATTISPTIAFTHCCHIKCLDYSLIIRPLQTI